MSSPRKLAARVYVSLRHATKRAFRAAGLVSIGGAKASIDVLLNRDRPQFSFGRLSDERYNVYLLFALTRIGEVGCSASDVRVAYKWLPKRFFFKKIQINWRAPTEEILLCENTLGRRPDILRIDRRYYSLPPSEHRLFAPYFAHPEFYRSGLHDAVRGMRGRERNVKIFFAGTQSESAYSKSFNFPILNRDKILRHLSEKFERVEKAQADESGRRSMLIVTTNDTRDTLDKHRLSIQNYMELMSRSEFFICPPGGRMPHSHNLIEAMSVGTIPITNYYSYMRPPLTSDENCLAFSTLQEFEKIVDRALQMPAPEVQHLREGVLSYYDKHLKPESFCRKLMERPASILEVVVNDESGR
jgi:hypothetical protein